MPVLLALMLNEIRMPRCKKVMQTVMTFPNFLSWVVVSSVLISLLSMQGPVNSLIEKTGGKAIPFLGNARIFLPMLYVSSNWKGMGWSSIIYLAAIAGVDQEQYEAAEIDGASRMQRITRITLPNILPTVSVMLILAMGGIMSGGFDQIFNLSNAATKDVSEVLDVYIYRITFQSPPDFGFSMAISLFRSAINLALLLIADRGAKMLGGSGLIG
jgi:putative aldouronate transport system permease protein